jgi:hypothetical protein
MAFLLVLSLPAVGTAAPIDFAHDILPLLKTRCAGCHTAGTYKGSVSMDTRESIIKSKAVVPGKADESPLVKRITSKDPDVRMPPKGDPLTDKEVALLRAWINEGVAWQDGFSFLKATYVAPLKPRRPELPPAQEGRTNPIDRIVDAYWSKHKITPPAPLDDAAFLRRVSLDLVGLLPTPAQLDAFLADTAPDKRVKVIRRLLDDKQGYTEHWLTFWNDLLRNDYQGTGFIDGGRKQITGWLYQSLSENKPYDRFVRELIAPTPESEGFIKGIKWRGNVNASQVPEVQFAQNITQVFLGVNLKCASCHDSFIDNWKLADSYGLAAVIADAPLEIHRCDKPTGAKAVARFLFPELGTLDATKPKNERLQRLAELMTSPDNGRLTRTIVNRLWQRLMGRGIVHPVDVMSNPPWDADLLDYLAVNLADTKYDLKKTLELIVTSRAYQSRSVPLPKEAEVGEYVFRGPVARHLTAEQFLDAIWRVTDTAPAQVALPNRVDRGKEPVRASLVVSDPLMRSLGRPNREQVVTTRPEELSTLQALDLTNGRVLAELLDRGAKNLRKRQPNAKPEEIITDLYRATLCRRPTEKELATARELLGSPMTDEGLSDLAWSVFMLPEFQFIR